MSGRNLPTATVAKQREKQTRAIRANLFVGQHAFHANRTIHARHQTHRASAKKASSGLVDFLPVLKHRDSGIGVVPVVRVSLTVASSRRGKMESYTVSARV